MCIPVHVGVTCLWPFSISSSLKRSIHMYTCMYMYVYMYTLSGEFLHCNSYTCTCTCIHFSPSHPSLPPSLPPSQRRFLVAFNEIQDISYEVELVSRGRVILDLRNLPVGRTQLPWLRRCTCACMCHCFQCFVFCNYMYIHVQNCFTKLHNNQSE